MTGRALAGLVFALALAGCGGAEEAAAPEPTGEVRDTGQSLPADPTDLGPAPAPAAPTEADSRFMTSLDTSAEINGVDFRQYGTDVELTSYGYRACELARTGLPFPGPLPAAVAGEMGAPDRVGELLTLSAVAILCPELIGPAK